MTHYEDIIKFWFEELTEKQHFIKDEKLDSLMRYRFQKMHTQAMNCEFFSWRKTPEGRLAEIIVLDQFPRNIYRDMPLSFSSDSLALMLSQEAIHCGDNLRIPITRRSFLYMPFMHSESSVIHAEAVKIFSESGLEGTLDYELKHKKIIDRFGRYPHRNKILGRISSAEELEFLKGPESSF